MLYMHASDRTLLGDAVYISREMLTGYHESSRTLIRNSDRREQESPKSGGMGRRRGTSMGTGTGTGTNASTNTSTGRSTGTGTSTVRVRGDGDGDGDGYGHGCRCGFREWVRMGWGKGRLES